MATLETLRNELRIVAKWRGHKLCSPKQIDGNLYLIKCKNCNRVAQLERYEGVWLLTGRVLSEDCRLEQSIKKIIKKVLDNKFIWCRIEIINELDLLAITMEDIKNAKMEIIKRVGDYLETK